MKILYDTVEISEQIGGKKRTQTIDIEATDIEHPSFEIQTKFCCGEMEDAFEHFDRDSGLYDDDEYDYSRAAPQIGFSYSEWGESFFDKYEFCPFCGEQLEYVLRKHWREVEKAKRVVKTLEEI